MKGTGVMFSIKKILSVVVSAAVLLSIGAGSVTSFAEDGDENPAVTSVEYDSITENTIEIDGVSL
jgi:hypothetical protein